MNVHAKKSRLIWYSALGTVLTLFLAACSSGTGSPAPTPDPDPSTPASPAQVTSNLPTDGSGVAGEQYTFGLRYDENQVSSSSLAAMAAGDEVIFSWIFGDGKDNGSATVAVRADGTAFYEVAHTYDSDGRYGVVFGVSDAGGNVLASTNFIVEIGTLITQVFTIEVAQCDGDYFIGGDGEYGVSLHEWDVSALPVGTALDFRFDTYSIPDKMIVEYPLDSVKYDSGWRGDEFYDGNLLYPGGVTGPAMWEETGLITIGVANNFLMTIIGPDPYTAWTYSIACNVL